MSKILFLAIILFGFNLILCCQNDTTSYFNKNLNANNFSIELGGKAYLYSIGYERLLYRSKMFLLTGNLNLSYEPFAGYDGILLPLGINTLIGKNSNKLLFGLHLTNGFNFTPYPKTRKERQAYRASGEYLYRLLFHICWV
jgi:hypothetical protein